METRNDTTQPDCDILRALVPAYSIGATDPDETRLVESLLEDCPEVAAELDAYTDIAGGLLFSAPDREPPQGLEERILKAASPTTSEPATTETVAPITESFFKQVEDEEETKRNSRGAFIWGVLAAVIILALLSTNVWWYLQVLTLQEREAQIERLINQQAQLLSAYNAGDTQRVELNAGDDAFAALVWENNLAILYADQLPPLAPERTYQLWLRRGDEAKSAGVFQTDANGSGSLIFEFDEPIESFEAVGISNEPAGGSTAPTTDPIAVGGF